MKALLENLEHHLRTIEGANSELLPPATDQEISAAESNLGITFPEDIRDFYKWHNGNHGVLFLFGEFRFLSLNDMVSTHKGHMANIDPEYLEITDSTGVFKECIANTKWIPIADNGGNTILLLDMAPGDSGITGQLLDTCEGKLECNFSGIRAFIAELIRKIETGEIVWNEQAGSFWPVEDYSFRANNA